MQWRREFISPSTTVVQSKLLVMGILNVTPDSFSDGGRFLAPEQALAKALQMIEEGADIIDIGGESTKPGALPISNDEELARVIPVITRLRKETDICISIDTNKAQVMHEAITAGASMINDISALNSREKLNLAAKLKVPVCLMHMQGEPQTMQNSPQYERDLVDEINSFFQQRIEACLAAGIERHNLIIDPGFGFGKTVGHNLRMVNKLVSFRQFNLPVMLGMSRKSTVGMILNQPVDKRLIGSLVLATFASIQGANIIRTHDIAETKQMQMMLEAINNAG